MEFAETKGLESGQPFPKKNFMLEAKHNFQDGSAVGNAVFSQTFF